MTWLAGIVGVWLLAIFWQLIGETLGEMIGALLRPGADALSRVFASARWPWPFLVVLIAGIGAVIGGYALGRSPAFGNWSVLAGVALVAGGLIAAIMAGATWIRVGNRRSSWPPR